MAKTALITGVLGQDGAYLAKLLLDKGYRVVGATRRASTRTTWRLEELGIVEAVEFVDFDLAEITNILRVIERVQPDEVYNLAAQSFVGASFEQPLYTSDTNAFGPVRVLEALRTHGATTRFYQASTSEMFGQVVETPQRETTAFHPRSPYGVAKAYGHWITVNYREAFGMHASSGILFNHESPLRGMEFVTRKITAGLARIAAGQQEVLELGNLSAQRDWGFAGDYVEGMWRMLQQGEGGDFVLATGQTHTIRHFAGVAAAAAGFDLAWEGEGKGERGIDRRSGRTLIQVNPAFYRPAEVELLQGDASRARDVLGWAPRVSLDQLAEMMVRADRDRLQRGQGLQ